MLEKTERRGILSDCDASFDKAIVFSEWCKTVRRQGLDVSGARGRAASLAQFQSAGGCYMRRKRSRSKGHSQLVWSHCKAHGTSTSNLSETCEEEDTPQTGSFSSLHVLINQTRIKRALAPLHRSTVLDNLARCIAQESASFGQVKHSDPSKVRDVTTLEKDSCTLIGENVVRGTTIREIHELTMARPNISDRLNILDERYRAMGIGTAKGQDGLLYLCQIFRG